ncbi:MAG: membrane protein insertase YidC [Campylobacteraceae bacterium]|nr:membrane protein insertase YidC [Campylobacteraceae bacterium]
MDEKSLQKRILIATLIGFMFFIFYDYAYLSKFRPEANATAQTTTTAQEYQAPTTSLKTTVETPAQTVNSGKVITTISSSYFTATIDDLGRISSFILNEEIYKDADGNALNLIDPSFEAFPLELRFADSSINQKAFTTAYVASASTLDVSSGKQSVVLTQNLGDVIIKKTLTIGSRGEYSVSVEMDKELDYFVAPGMRSNIIPDRLTVHGTLLRDLDDKLEILKDGKVKTGGESFENIDIISSFDRYYATLMYNFETPMSVVVNGLNNGVNQSFILAKGNFKADGFIGPKNQALLASINPELTDVVEYGWFTFIAKPIFWFLSWINDLVGNWGWAIVVMTFTIRLVLFPLTYKAMMSMNKLKDIAPKIKEIQEKYKNDPQKMQTQVMELYRKSGANPMGGCLPMLLQIPIFFAMYRVLLNAIELQGSEWIFWIENLAVRDPYFVLPILAGAVMFFHQKITPTNFTDPMQEKIMRLMPVFITVLFLTFPAGLTLYMLTTNSFAFLQQLVINRLFHKQKEIEKAEKR